MVHPPPTPRTRRDWVLSLASIVALAALMAHHGHITLGVPLGFALCLLAAVGILGLLGDSPLDLRGDEVSRAPDDPPWWRRPGTFVVGFAAVLYIPFAGVYGLWDPWETHYAEVAREILARDDWITTWWAQEGWFMSKPVLIFWMSALGMGTGSLFGLHFAADAGPNIQEWFIRLPIIALAIGALYALYRAVAGAWGERAGVLVALVLATMPQWFFLTHQAMTDMPFVASLTLAVATYALALTAEPEALAPSRRVTLGSRSFRISLWHLALGACILVALPQVVYLLTRPMSLGCPADAQAAQCAQVAAANRLGHVQFPFETFYSGSWGNSGVDGATSVPGSPPWERVASAVPFFPSVLQGILWAVLGTLALRALRTERRTQALHYIVFYFWCAISTLGKGPAGIAIPGAVALLHLLSTGRWRELQRIKFPVGALVFLVVGMPWYIALYGRLGSEFYERFVLHDIINRTLLGVHGDTGSVRYFIWQLGYAMFPWSGLVPMALVSWRVIVPADATRAQRDVARLGLFWFLSSFVLFSAMVTKFHHYILPALPGAAIVVGLLLHRVFASVARPPPDTLPGSPFALSRLAPFAALAVGTLFLIAGAGRCVGSLSGIQSTTAGPPTPDLSRGLTLAALGGALWLAGAWMQRPRGASDATRTELQLSAGIGALLLAAAGLVALIARDLVNSTTSPPGDERLIHLFVYNYDRPWPTRYLDYRGPIAGFAVAAMAVLVAMAWPRVRAYATRGLVLVATLFALWSLDVYMIQVTPHWSQRPLIARYYALRHPRARGQGEDAQYAFDPLIAHQMNWKGENFYTGNHVIAMECGLKYCTDRTHDWFVRHPGWRVYIITEHARVAGLLSTLRAGGGDGHTITTEADDNKFVLVEAHVGTGAGAAAPHDLQRPTGVANSQ